jgi:hypothetical protein
LSSVRIGEVEGCPTPERRRADANINDHIEDHPYRNTDQLGLWSWILEMQAANDPVPGSRDVILHEGGESDGSSVVLAPQFGERSSRIAKDLALEDLEFRKVNRSLVSAPRHRDCSFIVVLIDPTITHYCCSTSLGLNHQALANISRHTRCALQASCSREALQPCGVFQVASSHE